MDYCKECSEKEIHCYVKIRIFRGEGALLMAEHCPDCIDSVVSGREG